MTLSYSLGLTTGSAAAYLLDNWLGPVTSVNPCLSSVLNVTSATTTHLFNALAVTSIPA